MNHSPINAHELVATLKEQHLSLRHCLKDLSDASELPFGEVRDRVNVGIQQFKTDLATHLELEDTVFYPDYLHRLAEKGADPHDVKKFIAEMVLIGESVAAFIEKYGTPEGSGAAYQDFKSDLKRITSTLAMRIETEEEDVYEVYLTIV